MKETLSLFVKRCFSPERNVKIFFFVGMSLAEYLKEMRDKHHCERICGETFHPGGGLPIEQFYIYFWQMMKAVAFIHEFDIHCDIKRR